MNFSSGQKKRRMKRDVCQINATQIHYAVSYSEEFKVWRTVNKERKLTAYRRKYFHDKCRKGATRTQNVVGVAATLLAQIESRNHKATRVSPYRYQ